MAALGMLPSPLPTAFFSLDRLLGAGSSVSWAASETLKASSRVCVLEVRRFINLSVADPRLHAPPGHMLHVNTWAYMCMHACTHHVPSPHQDLLFTSTHQEFLFTPKAPQGDEPPQVFASRSPWFPETSISVKYASFSQEI